MPTATVSPIAPIPARIRRVRYFTRGSGHNRFGGYTEDDQEYTDVLDRVGRKIQNAARAMPAPMMQTNRAPRWGWSRWAAAMRRASRRWTLLAKEGIALDYMRVRGFPFGDEVRKFLESHEVNFVVEQNRDAQLRSLLMLETGIAGREARIGALLRRLPDECAPRDLWREGEIGAGGLMKDSSARRQSLN